MRFFLNRLTFSIQTGNKANVDKARRTRGPSSVSSGNEYRWSFFQKFQMLLFNATVHRIRFCSAQAKGSSMKSKQYAFSMHYAF